MPAPTTTTAPEPTATADSGAIDESRVETLVHRYVNHEREARGLDLLAFDADLRDIARAHGEDMATRDYFSHTNPEGRDVTDRYVEAGYECRAPTGDGAYLTGGENIAQTWYDARVRTDDGVVRYTDEEELARGLVTQWMDSPGHRENLLTPAWNREGIGIAATEDGKVYATQDFC